MHLHVCSYPFFSYKVCVTSVKYLHMKGKINISMIKQNNRVLSSLFFNLTILFQYLMKKEYFSN